MMSGGEREKERKEAPMDTVAGVGREKATESMVGVEYEPLQDQARQALALVSTQMVENSAPNVGNKQLRTNTGEGRVNPAPMIVPSMPVQAGSSQPTSKFQSAFQPGMNAAGEQQVYKLRALLNQAQILEEEEGGSLQHPCHLPLNRDLPHNQIRILEQEEGVGRQVT
jgi:hypothetical protein